MFVHAREKILSAKRILIACHIHPDGDCIGSLLALGLALRTLGKEVCMLSSDGLPRRYASLPGAYRIVKTTRARFDVAIAVDCGSKELLGSVFKHFEQTPCTIEIDHHEFRVPFAGIRIVDTDAAAVGEIIFRFLKDSGISITKEIAQNILTSIIVETNSFRLPNVRALTFNVCGDLMRLGVDFYSLVDAVFWSRSKEEAILSGLCLARCQFIYRGQIAWSIVRAADMKKIKGKEEDVDAVADQMRSITKVKIVIVFREQEGSLLRVSLRSKEKINIAQLAKRYGGGGHFDTAGCLIPNSRFARNKFLRDAQAMLKKQTV
ncbi:MAG: DHH family phosphoesterase [Candidatus Omnitrophota bacterium]|nr:DHH family phosphoesterase [Candidatus Omnitrophota bacterium]